MGIEGFAVVACGGTGLHLPQVAVVPFAEGGLGQGTQHVEIEAMLPHGLLGGGVDGVDEVAHHDGGQVGPAALLVVEVVDVLRDTGGQGFEACEGIGVAGFDAEGQPRVVHGDVAYERLRRPEDAVVVAEGFKNGEGGAAGSVYDECICGQMQVEGQVVECVVAHSEEVYLGFRREKDGLVDGDSADARGQQAGVVVLAREYLHDGVPGGIEGQSKVGGHIARADNTNIRLLQRKSPLL